MSRRITVKERHLGRHKAVGQAHLDNGLIEVDPRLKPKEWLSTLIHEALHHALPDLEEQAILRVEKTVADVLWKSGVRRVHVK
jgi:hypothetical protein